MFSLSQTSGYAILALSCLESCNEAFVQAQEIAGCTQVPLPYLSKILNTLATTELVESKRGYRGGFRLLRHPDSITLLEIVELVDGADWCSRCMLGLDECSDERSCPTHEFWKVERERLRDELGRITLGEIAEFERRNGKRLGSCGCET